jgi:hypothetical protein
MKELDLQPLVDAAVILDQEDREMRECDAALSAMEDRASTATPASLGRRLKDLGTWSDRTTESRWTTPVLWERLRLRIEREEDHPEVMALMGRLLTQAHAMRTRLVRMRRRIRDLELLLVGAVGNLRDQSADSRLLRLTTGECRSMTLAEMHETVEKDHAAIADAMATWRLSSGAAAVLGVQASSTVEDLQDALRRLERTGHARRTGPLFTTTRWTLSAAPEEDRKRA